ncbi:YrrS family protein [Bacillus tuaregi]|uniref:YrrS family protein n=1 Tax=Bacillus tuaregi TaxID=1816695 RepID=UPI0008F9655F|nr:YrrS family protein [Bacillus tuaregi]
MKDNKQPLNEKSRSLLRSKRRKTNIILNSLIIIVFLLIIFVSVKIFFGSDETASEKKNLAGADSSIIAERAQSTEENSSEKKVQDKEKSSDDEKSQNKKEEQNDQAEDDVDREQEKADKEKDKEKDKDKNKKDVEDEAVVTEGGSNQDVKKTIVNPGWEPLETSQAEPKPNEYGGQNWDEMVQAITYATGIDESNMTIIFLGNNGPNKSVGTILEKDTQQKYRVYIDWVEGSGWQPTMVEELNG